MGFLAERASVIAKHGTDDDLATLAVDLRVAVLERPFSADVKEAQQIIERAISWRRAAALGTEMHR